MALMKTQDKRASNKPKIAFQIVSLASPITEAFPAAVIYFIPPIISIITATIPTMLNKKLYNPTIYCDKVISPVVGSPGSLTNGSYACATIKLTPTNIADIRTTIKVVFFIDIGVELES